MKERLFFVVVIALIGMWHTYQTLVLSPNVRTEVSPTSISHTIRENGALSNPCSLRDILKIHGRSDVSEVPHVFEYKVLIDITFIKMNKTFDLSRYPGVHFYHAMIDDTCDAYVWKVKDGIRVETIMNEDQYESGVLGYAFEPYSAYVFVLFRYDMYRYLLHYMLKLHKYQNSAKLDFPDNRLYSNNRWSLSDVVRFMGEDYVVECRYMKSLNDSESVEYLTNLYRHCDKKALANIPDGYIQLDVETISRKFLGYGGEGKNLVIYEGSLSGFRVDVIRTRMGKQSIKGAIAAAPGVGHIFWVYPSGFLRRNHKSIWRNRNRWTKKTVVYDKAWTIHPGDKSREEFRQKNLYLWDDIDTTFNAHDVLGSGAFGTTFSVGLGNEVVALKLSLKSMLSEGIMMAAVAGRRQITQLIGTVGLKGSDEQTETGLLMELYSGGQNMHEMLVAKPNDTALALWSADVLEGLHNLHQANYAHLDVKGRNIMVDHITNRATIIDLGVAVQLGQHSSAGTDYYKSNDQKSIIKPNVTASIDTYAVGATLCKLSKASRCVRSQKVGFPLVDNSIMCRISTLFTTADPKLRPPDMNARKLLLDLANRKLLKKYVPTQITKKAAIEKIVPIKSLLTALLTQLINIHSMGAFALIKKDTPFVVMYAHKYEGKDDTVKGKNQIFVFLVAPPSSDSRITTFNGVESRMDNDILMFCNFTATMVGKNFDLGSSKDKTWLSSLKTLCSNREVLPTAERLLYAIEHPTATKAQVRSRSDRMKNMKQLQSTYKNK